LFDERLKMLLASGLSQFKYGSIATDTEAENVCGDIYRFIHDAGEYL
jgi:hypothetical protein